MSVDKETGEVFKNTKGSGVNKINTVKTNPTESKTQPNKAEPKIILKNPKFVKQGEAKTEEIKQGNAECSGNTSPEYASTEGSTSRGQYKKPLEKRSCFKCHQKGHVASMCTVKKKDNTASTNAKKAEIPAKSESRKEVSNSAKKSLQRKLEKEHDGGSRDPGKRPVNKNFEKPAFIPRQVSVGQASTSSAVPPKQAPPVNANKYQPPHRQHRHQSPQGDKFNSVNNYNNQNGYRDRQYSNNQHFSRNNYNQGYSNRGSYPQNNNNGPVNQRGYHNSQNQRPYRKFDQMNRNSPPRFRTPVGSDGY